MLSDDPFDDPDEAETDLRPDDPSDGLEIEIPEVPDPSEGLGSDLSESDVDPELAKQFWSLVLLFNVALFAMGLGLMLVGFERRWQFGGGVFLVGVFAFVRGWYRYKAVRKD
ncbi:DUF7322 domain-containing protein [Halorussus amylolyticus]|uniref:DUF7322 domain-containing protein n=1 Tax=Halorussus amylolyticus TaxID=1126242 RepID=UPI001EE3FD79|nr:hypothetical protein [Halorussus amylolyticus]